LARNGFKGTNIFDSDAVEANADSDTNEPSEDRDNDTNTKTLNDNENDRGDEVESEIDRTTQNNNGIPHIHFDAGIGTNEPDVYNDDNNNDNDRDSDEDNSEPPSDPLHHNDSDRHDDDNDEWKDLDFDDDNDGDDVDVANRKNQSSNTTDNNEEDFVLDSDDDSEKQYEMNTNNSALEGNDGDDDSNLDVRNAFVRHRRVTLEFIAMIEQEIYQNSLDSDDEDEDDDHGDDYGGTEPEYHGYPLFYAETKEQLREARKLDKSKDNARDDDNNDDEKEVALPVVKPIQYKKYGTSRSVQLITTAMELRSFCEALVQSAQKNYADHNNDPNAYAVGMDVEYCSLEMDIRNTLPAMIQLCGPDKVNGPIGLVWIHRFPDFGRDLLTNTRDYDPLIKIFADPKLYKVGVSLSNDTVNIAQWCGITDRKDVAYFFSGIVNIDEVQDNDNVRNKSLQEMAALVLQRNLPKIKGKRRSLKDRIRRAPTAHWRTDNITGLMKSYAANDVACAIDVWMRINNLQLAKKQKRKTAKITKVQDDGIDF
jgi:hypothetical protein